MNSAQVLLNIAIILMAAFFSGLVFRYFNQSLIVAYLVSGIFIGPYGLGLIQASSQIDILSNIGIILFMFVLGLSFPPKRIITMGAKALLGGALQVSLSILGVMAFYYFYDGNLFNGFLYGSLLAFSSTALVIKVLNDLALVDSYHGRIMVSYLIVQDIAAILMIAIFPSLGGSGSQIYIPILISLLKGVAFLILFFLLNRKIIPRAQYLIASIGGKELFLLGTIIFCLGMAVISYMIGLSLALGAFFAGLIVSESEYNYQILAGMVPFKDTFICIFFVSIGMLLDPRFLIHNPAQVFLLLIIILIGKFVITTLATSLAQYPLKTSILVGAGLAHIGPFSFVLVKMGLQYNLLSEHVYNLSLTASLLTMMITPFIIRMSPELMTGLTQIAVWDRWLRGKDDQDLTSAGTEMKNHIVICGYGPIGIMVGRVLKAKKIPFMALELNAATVIKVKKLGINCYYGDATSPEVLKKVNVERARIVVATTPDAMSSEAIVKNVKNVNPDCYIIARSRFSKELEELYDFGADSVIQEEFETGLSILVRVLKELKINLGDIKKEVETIKVERDELTKAHYFGPMTLSKQISPGRVILNLTSRTKEEAIRELIGAVASSRKIRDVEELIERVLEREEIEVTGIGDGIAIPHARTNVVDGIFVCIGVSKKGVEYGALDGKPVNIMILLVANESAHEQYLNALASVATFFKNAKFRQDIIKSTDPAHVIHLLKEREHAYKLTT